MTAPRLHVNMSDLAPDHFEALVADQLAIIYRDLDAQVVRHIHDGIPLGRIQIVVPAEGRPYVSVLAEEVTR